MNQKHFANGQYSIQYSKDYRKLISRISVLLFGQSVQLIKPMFNQNIVMVFEHCVMMEFVDTSIEVLF